MSDHLVIYTVRKFNPETFGLWHHYCTGLRRCSRHPRTRVLKDTLVGHWLSIAPNFGDCKIFRTHTDAINYATKEANL